MAESYELPETVVTAERVRTAVRDTSRSVEIITSEDMKRRGASNVTEALETALGLDMASGSQDNGTVMGSHQLMMRGMSSGQTLVLVDGRRLADEDTSSTKNMYLLSRLDLSRVDRIEVLRGPAGALYGSDAMGGVIQIITKKPGNRETTVGSHLGSRENSAYFFMDPGQEGRFAWSLSGRITKLRSQAFHRDSTIRGIHYDGIDRPAYGTERYISLDSLYDFWNRNRNTLRFGLDYFNETRGSDFADASMRGLVLQKEETSRTRWTEWNSFLTYEGNTGRHEYRGNLYYSRMRKKNTITNDRPPLPPYLDMVSSLFPSESWDRAFYQVWGLSGQDTLSAGSHKLTYGGSFEKNSYTGTRLSDAASSGERGKSQEKGALYLSDFWKTGRFVLTPSLRLEKGNSYGYVLSPSLGMTWAMDPHTRLKANWGKGFRAPTISEMYLHFTHMGVLVNGNPHLTPEKSRNFDVGLEWERGKSSGRITWFENRVSHLIDLTPITSRLYTYENVNRALLRGLEFSISHPLSSRLTATGGYTYLDARDRDTESRLPNRSRHTLTARLSYDDHRDYGYTAELWDSLKDGYYFDSQSYTYHLLSLSLSRHWGKAWNLTAGLYNMANKKISPLYVYGREWFLTLERHW